MRNSPNGYNDLCEKAEVAVSLKTNQCKAFDLKNTKKKRRKIQIHVRQYQIT